MKLTKAQKQFYEENGYIVLKNLIPEDELARVSEEYDKLFQRKNQEKMESSWVGSDDNDRKTDSATTVKGIHNLQYHHAVFGRLLFNDDLLDAVEDIMGTGNIVLHHTKAHFKPPKKGAAYPMHQVCQRHFEAKYIQNKSRIIRYRGPTLFTSEEISSGQPSKPFPVHIHSGGTTAMKVAESEKDYHYFPYEKDSMVAAFIHLDPATPENGGLFVYPGSHKLGPQEDVGAKEGNFHYVDQERFPMEKATPVRASRGDVVIFSYLLIHGSSPNNSTRPRRMFLIQLASADDRPLGQQPLRPAQGLLLRGVNVNRDASISKRFEAQFTM